MEELGSEAYVHVHLLSGSESHQIVVRVGGETAVARGDRVTFNVAGATHFFDPDGDRLDMDT